MQNIKRITIMLNILNRRLKNQDLHDYIFDKFECIADKTFKIKEISEDRLTAINKKDGDSFEIKFEPTLENFSKIITSYTTWNNYHTETKEIVYDDDLVSITHDESTIYTYPNKKISSLEKLIQKSEYKDNQLIHSYYFKSETGINSKKSVSGATIEEMYVLNDKSAVKFKGETDTVTTADINYYKTYFCNEPNFNTREESNYTHITNFIGITNDEYKEFISTWEKEHKGFFKQKI